MALIDEVRKALRITGDDFDDEITEIIESAKKDLQISGVEKIEEDDPLIKRSIILFAKSNFGMSNPESEKFYKQYERLKITMALSVDYKESD